MKWDRWLIRWYLPPGASKVWFRPLGLHIWALKAENTSIRYDSHHFGLTETFLLFSSLDLQSFPRILISSSPTCLQHWHRDDQMTLSTWAKEWRSCNENESCSIWIIVKRGFFVTNKWACLLILVLCAFNISTVGAWLIVSTSTILGYNIL